MASISIVNKRLSSLFIPKKKINESCHLPNNIHNSDSLNSYLNECVNLVDLPSALKAILTTNLQPADLNNGANIIAENIIPKVDNLKSVFSNKSLEKLFNVQYSFIDEYYSAGNYTDGINKINEAAKMNTSEPTYTSYKIILRSVQENTSADRVIHNHETLSRRYNFDKIVQENQNYASDDQSSLVYEVCSYIDTFKNVSFDKRINICLENILYLCNKNGVNYNIDNIAESVVDYLSINYDMTPDNKRSMYNIFKKNIFFNESKFAKEFCESYEQDQIDDYVLYLSETYNIDTEYMKDKDVVVNLIDMDLKSKYHEGFNEYLNYKRKGSISSYNNAVKLMETSEKINKAKEMIVTSAKSGIESGKNELNDDDPVTELIRKFKKQEKKDVGLLKRLINKVYAKNPEDAIKHTPSILNILRLTLVFGTMAFAPVVGLVLLIVDQVMALDINRSQTDKLLKYFEEERSKVEAKLNTASDEKKEKLKKYLSKLDEAIDKLDGYKEDLKSDVQRKEEDDSKEILNDMAHICALCEAMSLIDSFDTTLISNIIKEHSEIIPLEFIDAICEFTIISNGIINKSQILESLEYAYDKILNKGKTNQNLLIENINLTSCLFENINKIKYTTITPLSENTDTQIIEFADILLNLQKNLSDTTCLNESMSTKNTLKLAAINIKDKIHTVSDKAKSSINTINTYANKIKTSIEMAMTNSNRESVIKGSILPKFSTMLGLILTSGIAIALKVNIGIIVVGWLGIFACRLGMTKKERQMILDEIETDIDIIDKKIANAEREEDFEQYKQLTLLSKKLKREKVRIERKMAPRPGLSKISLSKKKFQNKSFIDDDE